MRLKMKHLKTCGFIGCDDCISLQNADEKLELKCKIEEIINSIIKDYHATYFVSGMEFEVEHFAVETALELKKTYYSQLTIESVVSYESFASNWDEMKRDKYYSIMQKIDEETLMQYHKTKDCLRKRNLYIINKSNYIVILCRNICEINDLTVYAKSKKKILFPIETGVLNKIPLLKILK